MTQSAKNVPVPSVCTGMRLRSWLGWLTAFGLILAALALWRRDVLSSPPYWDAAIGLWTEANFLAETDFDYRRLWTEEKSVWQGGARVYLTSILPPLLAIVMRLSPSTTVTLVGFHLFSLACTSAILLLVFALLRPRIGMSAAVLCSAAVLTTPLFSAQVDMVGMDLPMTLFALAAVWLFVQGRLGWAALAGLAAYLMKATGAIVNAAMLALLVVRLAATWGRPEPTVRHRDLWGVGANAAMLAVQFALLHAAGTVDQLVVSEHRTEQSTLWTTVYWCPELVVLLAAFAVMAAVVIGVAWARAWKLDRSRPTLLRLRAVLASVLDEHALLIVSALVLLATLAAIARIILIPRYLTIAVPFLYLVGGLALFHRPRMRPWATALLSLIVIVNLVNQHGILYPSQSMAIGHHLARTGAALERSREYLVDHRANQKAVAAMAERCRDGTLFVGHPFSHFVSFPRLGYVDEPLKGFALNEFSELATNLREIDVDVVPELPREPAFVLVGNTWYQGSIRLDVPQPTTDDELIYHDRAAAPLLVFRRRWPDPQPSATEIEDWYLRRLWPFRHAEAKAAEIARWLMGHGQPDRAIAHTKAAVEAEPRSADLRLLLARQLFEANRTAEAMAAAISILETTEGIDRFAGADSATGENHFEDAIEMLLRGNVAGARRCFEILAAGHSSHALTHYGMGLCHFYRGEHDAAAEAFATALRYDPELAAAHLYQGRLQLIRDAVADAEHSFRQAVHLDPNFSAAQRYLGTVLARQDRLNEAVEHFERAAALEPLSTAARRQLDRTKTRLPGTSGQPER